MQVVKYLEEHLLARKKLNEFNDCTVMAWANCFDASYEKSASWLNKFGRTHRRGMRTKDLESAIQSCKLAKVKIGPYSRGNRISLSQFCKKHPVGRYYVGVRGHALCVKDGVVYDHSEKPRRQVTFAARVYLKGEY